MTWHDGSPLTADDVSLQLRRDRRRGSQRLALRGSDRGQRPGRRPRSFLPASAPTPNLLSSLGGYKGLAIVQQANVESGDIQTAPIGTGPFKVGAWNLGDSIELVRNDDYWGGAPSPRRRDLSSFIPDPTVALTNLQAGEVHWTDNLPAQQVNGLKDSSDIVVESAPSNDYYYFAQNQAREPYSDARVRQALAWAIDRGAIVQAANFGNATVNQTAIPATSGWYHDYAPYTRDLDKARALLEEAGVGRPPDGHHGRSAATARAVTAAQVIAANLADIGVTVNIRTSSTAAPGSPSRARATSTSSCWAGSATWTPTTSTTPSTTAPAGFNFQGYNNPDSRCAARPGRRGGRSRRPQGALRRGRRADRRRCQLRLPVQPRVVQGFSPNVEGYTVRGDAAIRFDGVSLTE